MHVRTERLLHKCPRKTLQDGSVYLDSQSLPATSKCGAEQDSEADFWEAV